MEEKWIATQRSDEDTFPSMMIMEEEGKGRMEKKVASISSGESLTSVISFTPPPPPLLSSSSTLSLSSSLGLQQEDGNNTTLRVLVPSPNATTSTTSPTSTPGIGVVLEDKEDNEEDESKESNLFYGDEDTRTVFRRGRNVAPLLLQRRSSSPEPPPRAPHEEEEEEKTESTDPDDQRHTKEKLEKEEEEDWKERCVASFLFHIFVEVVLSRPITYYRSTTSYHHYSHPCAPPPPSSFSSSFLKHDEEEEIWKGKVAEEGGEKEGEAGQEEERESHRLHMKRRRMEENMVQGKHGRNDAGDLEEEEEKENVQRRHSCLEETIHRIPRSVPPPPPPLSSSSGRRKWRMTTDPTDVGFSLLLDLLNNAPPPSLQRVPIFCSPSSSSTSTSHYSVNDDYYCFSTNHSVVRQFHPYSASHQQQRPHQHRRNVDNNNNNNENFKNKEVENAPPPSQIHFFPSPSSCSSISRRRRQKWRKIIDFCDLLFTSLLFVDRYKLGEKLADAIWDALLTASSSLSATSSFLGREEEGSRSSKRRTTTTISSLFPPPPPRLTLSTRSSSVATITPTTSTAATTLVNDEPGWIFEVLAVWQSQEEENEKERRKMDCQGIHHRHHHRNINSTINNILKNTKEDHQETLPPVHPYSLRRLPPPPMRTAVFSSSSTLPSSSSSSSCGCFSPFSSSPWSKENVQCTVHTVAMLIVKYSILFFSKHYIRCPETTNQGERRKEESRRWGSCEEESKRRNTKEGCCTPLSLPFFSSSSSSFYSMARITPPEAAILARQSSTLFGRGRRCHDHPSPGQEIVQEGEVTQAGMIQTTLENETRENGLMMDDENPQWEDLWPFLGRKRRRKRAKQEEQHPPHPHQEHPGRGGALCCERDKRKEDDDLKVEESMNSTSTTPSTSTLSGVAPRSLLSSFAVDTFTLWRCSPHHKTYSYVYNPDKAHHQDHHMCREWKDRKHDAVYTSTGSTKTTVTFIAHRASPSCTPSMRRTPPPAIPLPSSSSSPRCTALLPGTRHTSTADPQHQPHPRSSSSRQRCRARPYSHGGSEGTTRTRATATHTRYWIGSPPLDYTFSPSFLAPPPPLLSPTSVKRQMGGKESPDYHLQYPRTSRTGGAGGGTTGFISAGCITEIYGEAGTGKTQLCLQLLCVEAARRRVRSAVWEIGIEEEEKEEKEEGKAEVEKGKTRRRGGTTPTTMGKEVASSSSSSACPSSLYQIGSEKERTCFANCNHNNNNNNNNNVAGAVWGRGRMGDFLKKNSWRQALSCWEEEVFSSLPPLPPYYDPQSPANKDGNEGEEGGIPNEEGRGGGEGPLLVYLVSEDLPVPRLAQLAAGAIHKMIALYFDSDRVKDGKWKGGDSYQDFPPPPPLFWQGRLPFSVVSRWKKRVEERVTPSDVLSCILIYKIRDGLQELKGLLRMGNADNHDDEDDEETEEDTIKVPPCGLLIQLLKDHRASCKKWIMTPTKRRGGGGREEKEDKRFASGIVVVDSIASVAQESTLAAAEQKEKWERGVMERSSRRKIYKNNDTDEDEDFYSNEEEEEEEEAEVERRCPPEREGGRWGALPRRSFSHTNSARNSRHARCLRPPPPPSNASLITDVGMALHQICYEFGVAVVVSNQIRSVFSSSSSFESTTIREERWVGGRGESLVGSGPWSSPSPSQEWFTLLPSSSPCPMACGGGVEEQEEKKARGGDGGQDFCTFFPLFPPATTTKNNITTTPLGLTWSTIPHTRLRLCRSRFSAPPAMTGTRGAAPAPTARSPLPAPAARPAASTRTMMRLRAGKEATFPASSHNNIIATTNRKEVGGSEKEVDDIMRGREGGNVASVPVLLTQPSEERWVEVEQSSYLPKGLHVFFQINREGIEGREKRGAG